MPRLTLLALGPLLLGLLWAPRLAAQAIVNPDFEAVSAPSAETIPGWWARGRGYEIRLDSLQPRSGRWSVRIRQVGQGEFATIGQSLPAGALIGKRIRYSGYIRTEGADSASLWARVDRKPGDVVGFANLGPGRGPRGTTGWTRFELELPVREGAVSLFLGALCAGAGTAWFDSLSIEVLEPLPVRVPSLPAAVPPPTAGERPEWAAWVREHAHPIRSLTSDTFSDLGFLQKVLKDRRVVQMGESGHGVAEFDAVKVRLVRYLHERLGYDVIAFESSLDECYRANEAADTLGAEQLMRNCIFAVWHAQETLPLFRYILQTRRTSHPLVLAGFDIQTSSRGTRGRPAAFRELLQAVDGAYAARVYTTDSAAVSGVVGRDSLRMLAMVPFYDSLAAYLHAGVNRIAAAAHVQPIRVEVAAQAAWSLARFAEQMAYRRTSASFTVRDSCMALNLDFLLDRLYAGRKLMVWGHNTHLAKHFSSVPSGTRTMGQWVAERRGGEVYTMGLYMYRGEAANNARRPYAVATMSSGGLESVLAQARLPALFLDLAHERREAGNSWMFDRIDSMSWGTVREAIVPREQYDGLLLIDTVHPPQYLDF